MRKVKEGQNCAQLPSSEAMNQRWRIPSDPFFLSSRHALLPSTHTSGRCSEGTQRYTLYGRVDIHVKASLCKITSFDVCVNYFTGTFLMCKTHSHANMFYKFHILNRPTWLTGQAGHRRSIRRYLRSLVLITCTSTREQIPVCHPEEFRLHGSHASFHGIQTAATVQPWLPSRFLSSPFLALTCLFEGLYFNLFMAFHVLHSCATMSPNSWPRP